MDLFIRTMAIVDAVVFLCEKTDIFFIRIR